MLREACTLFWDLGNLEIWISELRVVFLVVCTTNWGLGLGTDLLLGAAFLSRFRLLISWCRAGIFS